jgi:Tfp pilus assembly protein PilF
MNESDMTQTRKYPFYSNQRIFFAVSLVFLLVAAGCSTTSSSDKNDPSKLAQGGTSSIDAKKEFMEAVAIYEKHGEKGIGDAISALEDAVDEDPGFGKAWFNLGLLYEKTGRKEDARAAYIKATKTAVKLGDPHVNLGMMALEAGKTEEARQHFKDALKAESYNAAAHNNISVFYRKEEDFPKAVRHARMSLAGNASNIEAYANLARIYYRRGNFDVAKLVILNALKMPDGPKDPDLRNILGLVELSRNDVTEGIRQFEKAIELDPDHVPALLNLGAVILNVRDYPRALKLFERVLALKPESITAQISVAVAKRGMGDIQAADQIYQAILKEHPKNAVVQFNLGVLEHEHKAQNAVAGIDREPPAPATSDSASAQMMASAAVTEWNIENLEAAIEHYETAIDHYRNFLAYDKSGMEERRKEANKRIGQVATIIRATKEQIPQLRATVKELRAQAKVMAKQEAAAQKQAAAEKAAAQEKSATPDASAEDPGTAKQDAAKSGGGA